MDNLPLLNNDTQLLGTVATDEIANVHYPRSKVGWGADGAYVDASASNPLPVSAVQSGVWSVTFDGFTGVVHVDDNDGSLTVDNAGTFPVQISSALPAGSNVIGSVAQSGEWTVALSEAVTIDGAVTVVQDTAASLRTAAELYVSGNAVANDNRVPVSDGGGSLTIDGTVSISGSCDTELPAAAALADAFANPTAPAVAACLAGYNGTTWDRLRSDTAQGLDVDVTRVSGNVTVVQSTATSLRTAAELYVGGSAVADGNRVPVSDGGGSLTIDGTVSISGSCDTELPAAAALADAFANPTAPAVAACLAGYNGTTWDRLRGDTAQGLDVDVTRVQGTVAVTQSGTWTVGLAAGTNSAGKFIPEASASGVGTSAFRHATLSNTAQDVKASAGRVYGLHCYNPNSSDVFLQFYDHASPTVGSTTPTRTYAVPARGWLTLDLTIPHAYSTAIKTAVTTTATGSTAPGTGLLVDVEFV